MDTVAAPTPEDLAAERLIAAVESAIDGIQERLANLAANGQDAKWSVSDLVKLLQLRDQLQGERPSTISVRWIDNPNDIDDNNNEGNNHNEYDNQPGRDIRLETYIDSPNRLNKETRK
jgi:hypothetical protein